MHPINKSTRENNLDLLRLIFAAAVILSHCWRLVDGNYKREPLFLLTGHLKIGEVAVDGFFLLSGYLILASWIKAPEILEYGKKRVLRIYPAFVVASVLAAVIGALLNRQPLSDYLLNWKTAWNAISLGQPTGPDGVMQLNVPLWTIRYEFFCYAVVGGLGLLFRKNVKWPWVAAWALTMCVWISGFLESKLQVISLVRFLAFFLTGGMFYLFKQSIVYRRPYALLACALLVPALISDPASRAILPVAGGYLVFHIGFLDSPLLNRLRPTNDVSYGVYLYGWPVQKLLIAAFGIASPILLFAVALPAAALLGFLSWKLVEEPFLRGRIAIPSFAKKTG